MTLTGWVARHTGMPSLRTDQAGPIMAGDRLVAVAPRGGTIVSDPQAPIGRPVSYQQGAARVTLTRASMGSHLITDASGHTIVRVRVSTDEEERHSGVKRLEASGGGVVSRWPLVAPPAVWRLECLTVEPYTERLRGLVQGVGVLTLLHDPSVCQVPGCDIEPVRLVTVDGGQLRRTHAVHRATREWELTCTEASASGATGVGVVTWGEWDARDHHWAARSYEELCRLVAGMPA